MLVRTISFSSSKFRNNPSNTAGTPKGWMSPSTSSLGHNFFSHRRRNFDGRVSLNQKLQRTEFRGSLLITAETPKRWMNKPWDSILAEIPGCKFFLDWITKFYLQESPSSRETSCVHSKKVMTRRNLLRRSEMGLSLRWMVSFNAGVSAVSDGFLWNSDEDKYIVWSYIWVKERANSLQTPEKKF